MKIATRVEVVGNHVKLRRESESGVSKVQSSRICIVYQ